MLSKKKIAAAATAVALSASILLGGTYAWQSVNQVALNEASDVVNPGGRLHDDFNGENKDVYVENFADEPIFARVRLEEYFGVIMNQGSGVEERKDLLGSYIDGQYNYVIHSFPEGNVDDAGYVSAGIDEIEGSSYWSWATGGSTVYMPTFNKDKDSLKADVNGTYAGPDGDAANTEDKYLDYVEYSEGDTLGGQELYDADVNDVDDGNVKYVDATHTATSTETSAPLMSMKKWIDNGMEVGPYWVCDEDGWVYWAQAIEPHTATGLLLDSIQLNQVMDDSWFYAINVVGQFVTADDVGKDDGTGFYNTEMGTVPSEDAELLLAKIGVDMGDAVANDELQAMFDAGGDITIDGVYISSDAVSRDDFNQTYNFIITEGGTVSGGTLDTTDASFGLFINAENDWPVDGDGANDTVISGTSITGKNNNAAVYTQAIDADITLKNVKVTSDAAGVYNEHGSGTLTIENSTVTSLNNAPEGYPWLNSAVAAANGGNVVINGGTYIGNYAAYVFSTGGSIEINDGYFSGELRADAGTISITGGTFTVDPSAFVAEGYEAVDNGNGTWSVQAAAGEESGSGEAITLTYSVVEPADWDGFLARGESVTLKVDGDYTAEDLEWSCETGGADCINSDSITINEDGSATISHVSSICGGSGGTVSVSLVSDPSVYLDIVIGCDQ